jgi:hypothetical protein
MAAVQEDTSQATGWLPLNDGARHVKCGRTTLHMAASRGEIPFAVTPLGRLFAVEDLEAWAAQRETTGR